MKFSNKLLAIFTVFILLLGVSSADKLSVLDSQKIYEYQDDIKLTLKAENRSNYSLAISESNSSLKKNFSFQNSYNISNKTFYNHSTTYAVPNYSQYRVLNLSAWENSNGTLVHLIDSLLLNVASDKPEILNVDLPGKIYPNQTVKFKTKIADSKENYRFVNLTTDTLGEKNLSKISSSDNYVIFSTNISFNDFGKYDYNLSVKDNSSSDRVEGRIGVRRAPRESSAEVGVSVDRSCMNITASLESPGNEPLNLITTNTSGSFVGEIYNRGNIGHLLDVSLDVTAERNDSWDPGEEIGPVVVSYKPEEFNLTASGKATYFRIFTAIYEPGNYTGRMKVDSECFDQEDNKLVNYTFNITDNFEIVDIEGEDSLLEKGNQTTNQSIPADANRKGSESDQTLEGDNNMAGSTPRPRPEPTPALSINMDALNFTYNAKRGQYADIGFNISNFADKSFRVITLSPMVNDLNGEWNVREGRVSNVGVEGETTQSVFIQPGKNVSPGRYRIPVMARLTGTNRGLDVEYANIRVKKEVFKPSLEIIESPRSLEVEVNSTEKLPVLVRNNGEEKLNGVHVSVQNFGECGEISFDNEEVLSTGEKSSFSAEFRSGSELTTCQGLIVVSSEEGAYSFANIEISVVPSSGFIPAKFRVPLVATVWTALLVVYAVVSRRMNLESIMVKVPFVMLLMGETVIMLYLASSYYGILPKGFLPF